MKKRGMIIALLIAILCIGTTSCTKDDDEDSKNKKENIDEDDDDDIKSTIVGTWEYDDGDGWTVVLRLNSNSSFKLTETEVYQGKPDVSITEGSYKYNSSSKTLTLSYYDDYDDEDYVEQIKVVSLTSSKLTLQFKDDDGSAENITFIKQ